MRRAAIPASRFKFVGMAMAVAVAVSAAPAMGQTRSSPNDVAICRNDGNPYTEQQAEDACWRLKEDGSAPADLRAIAYAQSARRQIQGNSLETAKSDLATAKKLATSPTVKAEIAQIEAMLPTDLQMCANQGSPYDAEWAISACERLIATKSLPADTKAKAYAGRARQMIRYEEFGEARQDLKKAGALASTPDTKSEIAELWKQIPVGK